MRDLVFEILLIITANRIWADAEMANFQIKLKENCFKARGANSNSNTVSPLRLNASQYHSNWIHRIATMLERASYYLSHKNRSEVYDRST